MSVPFNFVLPTVYGLMIVNRNDINQTTSLLKTGQSLDHGDIVLLSKILSVLDPNPVVVDVGANFGTYTLGLAPYVGPKGKVHAFEPQRMIFNMLAGSVALNSILNVHCHNMAVGSQTGKIEVPQFDYALPLNFGSIEFTKQQRETLAQERGTDPERVEHVQITTLDDFGFARLDLLKIDVEGMEIQVLEGATQTIIRCQPVMFVECIKSDREALRRKVISLDYMVFESPMNYLCVHARHRENIKVFSGRIGLHSRNRSPQAGS